MNKYKIYKLLSVLVFSLIAIIPAANAGLIDITLGNGSSGLSDGDTPNGLDILAIQSSEAGVFQGAIGHDLFTDPEEVNWLFDNGGAITDTIIAASLSFGIWDLDSAAPGSQLFNFSLDGFNYTPVLDTQFEAAATLTGEYNIFTINFDSSFFTDLTDGLLSVALDVTGNGFTSSSDLTNFNKYLLIYSSLTIETQDFVEPEPDPDPEPTPVPEPGTLAIFALGMIGLASRRFKKQS